MVRYHERMDIDTAATRPYRIQPSLLACLTTHGMSHPILSIPRTFAHLALRQAFARLFRPIKSGDRSTNPRPDVRPAKGATNTLCRLLVLHRFTMFSDCVAELSFRPLLAFSPSVKWC